jgi:hypothetical protein
MVAADVDGRWLKCTRIFRVIGPAGFYTTTVTENKRGMIGGNARVTQHSRPGRELRAKQLNALSTLATDATKLAVKR